MAQNIVSLEPMVGDRITVDETGMLRVAGVPVCRVMKTKTGVIQIEVKDRMRSRSETRGSDFVYASMNGFVDALVDYSKTI